MPGTPPLRTDLVARRAFAADFDRLLARLAQISQITLAIAATLFVLHLAEPVLAPLFIAMLVGLVFGPSADWLEARSIRPALSAGVVVLAFIGIITAAASIFAAPAAEWVGRVPAIWEKLRAAVWGFRGPLESMARLQTDLESAFGAKADLNVAVDKGNAAQELVFLAPAVLGEVLIFLGALYFFVAARHRLRIALLSFCYSRRLRWRAAHVFRDMENRVSRYFISVGTINLGVGVMTTIALSLVGAPTPWVFGAMAGFANFVPYVGQLLMFAVFLVIGVGTQHEPFLMFAPLFAYAAINFAADQIVFPHLVGHALTLSPFVIFVAVIIWIFLWGPLGSLLAVPSLIVLYSLVSNLIPRTPTPEPLPPAARRARIIAQAGKS